MLVVHIMSNVKQVHDIIKHLLMSNPCNVVYNNVIYYI